MTHHSLVPGYRWRWANFTPAELACRHCGALAADEDFLDRLQALRDRFGRPLRVNSGYRCAEHNQRVSATGPTGPHTTGRAIDLGVMGGDAHAVLALALEAGWRGIGVAQRGAHGARFIHLDDLDGGAAMRPTVWSY